MQLCPTCQRPIEDGVARCPHDGTALPQAANPWLGKVLGDRYRVLAKLGEGGMGTVYLAEHVVLGKQLAIKVLRETFSSDEELVRRFQQEAIAASQIGHENIVDITDFGRAPEGALYFVMEKLDGDSLARLVQRDGPLPPARALPILIQICRALAAAHSRGIVHRDLKPDNVMVLRRDDGSELVKVLDFGISKVSQGQAERITRVGMMMGTPEYMAPEQVDAASADHRVDIYALGVLAYEVVTGKVPFEANTPVKLLLKHQTEPPLAPSARRPDLPIPARLEAAILKALAKLPADRHASMAELAHELAACGRELGVMHFAETVPPLPSPSLTAPIKLVASLPPATPPSLTDPAGAVTVPADDLGYSATLVRPPTPAPAPEAPEAPAPAAAHHTLAPEEKAAVRRSSGAVIAVLVVLVLALGGGLGYLVLHRQAHKDDVQPPVPLTDSVEAPSLLPAGSARRMPAAQAPASPEPAAPPTPEPAATPPVIPIRRVILHSRPEGAKVLLGGDTLGTTPWTVELKEGEAKTVRLVLSGYAPLERQVTSADESVTVTLKRLKRRHGGARGEGEGDDPYRKIEDLKANPF